MNLLLLSPTDLISDELARITRSSNPAQFKHIQDTLKAKEGERLRMGIINQEMGTGVLTHISSETIEFKLDCQQAPPPPLPLRLIVALPRPKMLRRIIQTIATLGVKELYLINSWKVEKSYWQTPWLAPEQIHENLILGLEQACDTQMPIVHQRKLFKPFVEDELAEICQNTRQLLAHPGENLTCPVNLQEPVSLAIGPEGGFTPYEVGKLKEVGFQGVSIGPRILRVETAVTSIVSRLFCP